MSKYFGGSYLVGKRKSKRPLDEKNFMHVVLRLKENLPAFFSPRDTRLRNLFCEIATKHEIQINHLIFNHIHLHGTLGIKDHKGYNAFIREFTSKVVAYLSKSTGIKLRNIFLHRPFMRIVSGFGGLLRLDSYMRKNEKESRVRQIHLHLGLNRFLRQISRKTPGDRRRLVSLDQFRQLEFF